MTAHAISPTPSDEEAVAIAAAIEFGWPRPVVMAPDDRPARTTAPWRFSGRWWMKSVPEGRGRP
jgi:hypothetical protein